MTVSIAANDAARLRVAPAVRLMGTLALLGLLAALLFRSGLAFEGAATVFVFGTMMLGWIVLSLPQTPVALAGALALVALGVVEDDDLFEALGDEIIWIMVAAFLVAAVLSATGLAERLSLAALSRLGSVTGLFWAATAVVAATAFVIPSTSARAAILFPVYAALAAAAPRPGIVRGLGLLFPTVILLSAAMSLTGAGAHLVAVDFVDRAADREIGNLEWIAFGAPVAMLTCAVACLLILRLFLDAEDRAFPLDMPAVATRLDRRELTIVAVACLIVVLFATEAQHGLALGVVGMAGALVLCSKTVSGVGFSAALKKVDWDLLIFLAATLCVGEAVLDSGAAEHLLELGLAFAGDAVERRVWLILAVTATASALAHLVIISRTARATVLIPALALPMAGMGVEPHLLIMTTAIGSGFCQTFTVSAKPVMLFAAGETPPFGDRDLLRLAAWLFFPFVFVLTLSAAWLWPLIPLSD